MITESLHHVLKLAGRGLLPLLFVFAADAAAQPQTTNTTQTTVPTQTTPAAPPAPVTLHVKSVLESEIVGNGTITVVISGLNEWLQSSNDVSSRIRACKSMGRLK